MQIDPVLPWASDPHALLGTPVACMHQVKPDCPTVVHSSAELP